MYSCADVNSIEYNYHLIIQKNILIKFKYWFNINDIDEKLLKYY